MGIYNSDGQMKLTEVDGTSFVGAYAEDGSFNAVIDDGTYYGSRHPSGAYRFSTTTSSKAYDTDGSLIISSKYHYEAP